MSKPIFGVLLVLIFIVASFIRIKYIQPIKNRSTIRRIRIIMIIVFLLIAIAQFISVLFL